MKAIRKSEAEPVYLERYREAHPEETWQRFREHSPKWYREIKRMLLEDQHGLCAYCEINLKAKDSFEELDDFRVEHFYPKSMTQEGEHNYHLDWQNLLGVCHGGSQATVTESESRYAVNLSQRSCDAVKANKEICEDILNPVKLSPKLRIFSYDAQGHMFVDEQHCPVELKEKAANTIRELNLNCARLCNLRKEVVQYVQDELYGLMEEFNLSEDSLRQAERELAEAWLSEDEKGNFAAFFSAIRYILGDGAEDYLKSINFRI